MPPARRPIDVLFDQADLRCAVCNTPRSVGCGCHTQCRCGWLFRKGETCNNPTHAREDAAQEVAARIAANVLVEMREAYPEPMKYAAGGFAKALRGRIQREAGEMVLAILETKPDSKGGAT